MIAEYSREYGHLLEKIVVDFAMPIDVAHYILMALAVREETGPTFSLEHPFASWFCSLLLSFSGTFLTNFFLGESLLDPLLSKNDMILFTIIWYHICILDTFAGICQWKPVKNGLSVAKEFQRNHKVMLGVAAGASRFPAHAALHVLVGCSKGNGTGIVKIVQQFVYGKWVPTENELLKPSTTTKATILAATLYTTASISHEVSYLCGACVLVGAKVLAMAEVSKSPLDTTYDRLRFTLIQAPRMLESLIVGSSTEPEPENAEEEEEKPLADGKPLTSTPPEVTSSSEVPEASTQDEWRHEVTGHLRAIAEMSKSNGQNIDRVSKAIGDADPAEVHAQILAELRELKELILAAGKQPASRNPSPDSSTVLLSAPEDTVDEE